MVIVGGPVGRLGEPVLEPIRREVHRRRALSDALTDLEIVPSALGAEAGAIGAAALFLESLESFSIVAPSNRIDGRQVAGVAGPMASVAGGA
jgi:hypothetical protein